MERRRALTIPFADKDKMMENPLKIPVASLPSECGKLEGQVSWTAFADCKYKSHNSRHKNGSTVFNCSHAALKSPEMLRRKPRLILTDILKTELGKDYIEKTKMSSGSRRLSSSQKDDGRCREEDQPRSGARTSQAEERNNKRKSATSNGKQGTPTSQRHATRNKKPQNAEEEDSDGVQDIKEVIIGKDHEDEEEEKFAEVVDCGLSLSWSPTEDTAACDEISVGFTKDKLTGSEQDVQHSSKRKRRDPGLQCNGALSPKRKRESVLRRTGGGKDGGQTPIAFRREESEEDVDLESMDRCILQFTVGGEDGLQPLVPLIPEVEPEGIIIGSNLSLLPRDDGISPTSPPDPIVLSSDEESSDDPKCRSKLVRKVASSSSTYRRSSKEPTPQHDKASDTEELLQMLVEESPPPAAASPGPEDYSSLSIPFLSMYCGCYRVRAEGGLMIAKHRIIIPLKATNEQLGMLTFERKELRRYSVWDQQDLEVRGIRFEEDVAPSPAGVLLLYVTETVAETMEQQLYQLCLSEDGPMDTGKASPIILLTLKDPLEGMEGALLRSVLDIDCINRITLELSANSNVDGPSSLLDIDSPVLSLDDSIKLITRVGAASNLLSILGIKSPDSDLSEEQDSFQYDEDELPTAHIWVDTNYEKDVELDVDMAAEDGELEDGPTKEEEEEVEEEEEPQTPPDSKKEEAKPVYTVCHRRREGSYSVSLCKPDSKWTKFRYQGLTQRLIQFPPPPLKGGITVTMEDLKCLDAGKYLNDVIIDFYLKYLIQNASAAISERSHIFSSFFYKQLTRRDNASEGGSSDSCQRQRRHQRVKTWTRHVDIFNKDFLFVPVNQEAHWYLVVICFPGLDEPQLEDWVGAAQEPDETKECKSSNDPAETLESLDPSVSMDAETENSLDTGTKDLPPPCPVSCTEQTCQRRTVCRRPCILIMDSLKLSSHERICKLLREYLQSEWEVRRGSSRDFGPDQLKSSHCQVPLQDNSSDCGLYLLQYVECFLKDPVVHFDLPLQLRKWFSRQVVRQKRDEIRNLILNLYRHQNLESKTT